jgi:hypothetical protein
LKIIAIAALMTKAKKRLASGYTCPHVSLVGDVMFQKDLGHPDCQFRKVLYKRLNGIKEDVERYLAQLDQRYLMPFQCIALMSINTFLVIIGNTSSME